MKKIITLLIALTGYSMLAQTLNPYLQAATPYSIYVNWKTDTNPESIVEYGTSPTDLLNAVSGTNTIFSDTGYPNNYYYHSVKIEGLQPNTKYYYRAVTGSNTSEILSFKTMPLPGQAATADGHLRFLLLGDNQMRNLPRFDTLVAQSKRKISEKWGAQLDPSDNIALTVMVGDQVDTGTLDHYENVHFKKNKELSGLIPIQTLVGNHETYGTLGMNAYYDHYVLDEMVYQGISSGTENYYVNQVGNVLFICLDTEHTSATQLAWVQQILSAAENDTTVDWIISLGHRPYQAEQYIGDISSWVRNTVIPYLTASPKHILHVGAHHHLYHRGQLKNTPTYQIISGGVAWDQYWGMSTEQDYEDVQKTIANWAYSIIDIDVVNDTFNVETYSIGSVYEWKNNELIDEFHREKNKPEPNTPEITTDLTGQELELPILIETSPYETSTNELLNSTEFLISKASDFSTIVKSYYRDYENWFGGVEGHPDQEYNLNEGVDITKYTIQTGELENGLHYIKYRQRDRNLNWSDWSPVKSFQVINSTYADPQITLSEENYQLSEAIAVNFTDGPGNAKDWIGIYHNGQNPGGPASTLWKYVNNSTSSGASGITSGQVTFPNGLTQADLYFAAFLENDGYTEIAPRQTFYAGPIPVLTTDEQVYTSGSDVVVTFQNIPHLAQDWIGIYKVNITPGSDTNAIQWEYITNLGNTANGNYTVSDLADGYYFAGYFLKNGYYRIGEKAFFQVGELITNLATDATVYNLNENIMATWTDAPGLPKDWLGIYNQGDDPSVDPLISYTYFNGLTDGSIMIPEENMPQEEGNYFIVMFTNDSYTEVSNRVDFEIIDLLSVENQTSANSAVQVYPNPAKAGEQTYIKSKYPIDRIDMFDMTGNLFYTSKNVNDYNFSLINQNLPKGTYILRIHSNKIYNVKMIIN